MNRKRQQVLFIEHILWGGGQEKVTYNLAHLLDPDVFEPHVAYLNYRENVPVKFDPSIPIYCLDPMVRGEDLQPRTNAVHGQRIRRFILSLFPKRIKDFVKNLIQYNSLVATVNDAAQTPLQQSFSPYNTYLGALRNVLSKMDEDALVVAFQETPTVLAWLNQIYGGQKYLSFLCAPESLHMRFLYQNEESYKFEKWAFGNACRSASTVTVPNEWIRSDLHSEFAVPLSVIQNIPNPINCSEIKSQSEAIWDFDADTGRTIFVQLARMDPQKNHDLTVKACELLRKKYDDFVVYVIGDGSERERIQRLVNEARLQNHIVFLGALSNPYPLLKQARASILTSSFEASPLALIDSMYLGAVPVSVDCISGPAEQLGEGQYGLLVPPNDPSAFAEAMYRIAKDDLLWFQLRSAGMKHAENFDIKRFVEIWTKMLLEAGIDGVGRAGNIKN